MATITASTSPASLILGSNLSQKRFAGVPSSVIGLPTIMSKKGRVSCSLKESASVEKDSNMGMGVSMMAAICAATMSSPAMALVDERMSTEGTGLPFGLSNNLLGWILFGVFGLIWSLYFVYVSGLDEDEESGLSL